MWGTILLRKRTPVYSMWHLLNSYLYERKPRYFDNMVDNDSQWRRDLTGLSRANYRDLLLFRAQLIGIG